jgi:hypothetical protein
MMDKWFREMNIADTRTILSNVPTPGARSMKTY